MKLIVDEAIFDRLPKYCIGVVVVRGFDPSGCLDEIRDMLDAELKRAESDFKDEKVKESAEVVPYREAFRVLGMNPNKYQCSMEALLTRVAKGKGLPYINAAVDLNNAFSLKYRLPMGTHDIKGSKHDMMLRFSEENDRFIPFGSMEEEVVEAGEVVYATGHDVRTRRWTWRQSEIGKITETSSDIFFPIDGFAGINDERVKAAVEELAAFLRDRGCGTVITGFADRAHPAADLGEEA